MLWRPQGAAVSDAVKSHLRRRVGRRGRRGQDSELAAAHGSPGQGKQGSDDCSLRAGGGTPSPQNQEEPSPLSFQGGGASFLTQAPQPCSLAQARLPSFSLPKTFYVLVEGGAPGPPDIFEPTITSPAQEGRALCGPRVLRRLSLPLCKMHAICQEASQSAPFYGVLIHGKQSWLWAFGLKSEKDFEG